MADGSAGRAAHVCILKIVRASGQTFPKISKISRMPIELVNMFQTHGKTLYNLGGFLPRPFSAAGWTGWLAGWLAVVKSAVQTGDGAALESVK